MTKYANYFLGSKYSRLIDGHIKAEELYEKILNHDGSEAYCCYFDLDENLLKLEWDTGKQDNDGKTIYEYHYRGQNPNRPDWKCNGPSFAEYEGICRPALNMVSFDFDSEDPEESLRDVRKFVEWLDTENIVVFFSGSKGFHIMVPFGYFPLEANEHLPNQLKDLAKHLKEYFPTLDDSIYNYNRKFRVPFTKHDKSGLFKDELPFEMVLSDHTTIGEIVSQNVNNKNDFWNRIRYDVKPLEVLSEAIEESKRKSYEIEKEKAGSKDLPSPFEKFDDKLCIKKMLESRCDDIGRNNACLRIVNDYYRTGKPQSKCEKDVSSWAGENGLPLAEVSTIINNIYQRNQNYNFGCQDDCKSSYCSAKCTIWKKLDPDKRPTTVDMPASEAVGFLRNDFTAVQWLMENLFGSFWLEDDNQFTEGLVAKQDATNIFYYKDNHWQHLDESKIHIIKTKLNAHYKNKLSVRKLNDIYKMFVLYVPEVPAHIDLFAPRNTMANFLDGTLHLERVNNKFELVFKEHDKLNFCTTMIDLKYSDFLANTDRKNEMFEDWLLEYLEGDTESFKLIGEMFGASLMPKFPQFFVLLGKSGTGKSTTIKILKQLHKNEKNISGVSPDKFHGFHMASMIGKLMNIVGDIKTNCRIDDDVVKQVDDQEVVRIEIKKRDDVYTKLPALHIFGANKMPATSEGYSGAMKRRFSIINFDKQFTGKKNTEIAKDMFNHDPLGVLAFALRGLKRLVIDNSGEYTATEKSQSNVDEWSKETDVIWLFLNSILEEPIDVGGKSEPIKLNEDGKILRSMIWKMFSTWQEINLDPKGQLGKQSFLKLMKSAGFKSKRFTSGWYIQGISVDSFENDDI